MEFGAYVQEVLAELAVHYGWDDPYASISPAWDFYGRRLTLLYQSYNHRYGMLPVEEVARLISEQTMHWESDPATQTVAKTV